MVYIDDSDVLKSDRYKSANTITFDGIQQSTALLGHATFAMDRGNDVSKT